MVRRWCGRSRVRWQTGFASTLPTPARRPQPPSGREAGTPAVGISVGVVMRPPSEPRSVTMPSDILLSAQHYVRTHAHGPRAVAGGAGGARPLRTAVLYWLRPFPRRAAVSAGDRG